jgi:hypothetical protein
MVRSTVVLPGQHQQFAGGDVQAQVIERVDAAARTVGAFGVADGDAVQRDRDHTALLGSRHKLMSDSTCAIRGGGPVGDTAAFAGPRGGQPL